MRASIVSSRGHELSFPETIMQTGKVSGKLWEKEGKARVYFKVFWGDSAPTDCGYVDMNDGAMHLSSQPRPVARNLSFELEYSQKQ